MSVTETKNEPGTENILYPVPALPTGRRVPAAVQSITIEKRVGEPDVMRIIIKRDLSFRIEGFTFRYRFSAQPIYSADAAHPFSSYEYTDDDLNTSELINICGTLPGSIAKDGCSAYISEIRLSGGRKLTFDAADYTFVRRPARREEPKEAPPTLPRQPSVATPNPAYSPKPQIRQTSSVAADQKKNLRRTVILVIVIFVLLVEALIGVYAAHYLGDKNSVDYLIKEDRYNEAFKMAEMSGHNSLLQRVCEKAAVYYFSTGDLESAYIYASGAPDPFPDMIIDYAAQSVVSLSTGELNETALRVAKMSENDDTFDAIIHTVCEALVSRGDYSNALRVVTELRANTDRLDTEWEIFRSGLHAYLAAHDYHTVIAYIEDLFALKSFDYSDAQIVNAVLSECSNLGDIAGVIYFANRYPALAEISAAQTTVAIGDPGVRAELSTIYPLLSADQKRSYHASPITVQNGEVYVIESGRIEALDVKNAVSIEANEDFSLVLSKNGGVTLIPAEGYKPAFSIPSYADVVQIAVGEAHAVLLHDNGTVSAYGDNTSGQCDVSGWTDIIAIAAGQRFTVGLKRDGTLTAVGSDICGQCNVSSYRNVVGIAAANLTTVILFADGTVQLQGYRSYGLADAETMTDAARIRAGGSTIIAETKSGRFDVFSGQDGGSCGDPYNWRDIIDFHVGAACIAAIDKNGAVFVDGDGIAAHS